MMRLLRFALVVAILWPPLLAAEPLPRSVLLIEQENQSRVWNFDLSTAFRSAIGTIEGPPITVYADNLDLARVSGVSYELALRNFFLQKYKGIPIGVIVVTGARALDFAVSIRSDLWPDVPIIFAAVDEATAARMATVPNVTGHTMRITLRDMVSTARIVDPGVKRIALVGDPLDRNTYFRGFIEELPEQSKQLQFIDLTGLPMAEIKKRTSTLPSETVIAYTTITVDGAGIDFLPREAAAAVASVANRPIVTGTENYIGYGAVGGRVVRAPPIGAAAGKLAGRILNGESASSIPVTAGDFSSLVFDWKQLKLWSVDEKKLPAGSDLRFRDLTMWEQYRPQVIAGSSLLVLQAAIISWLLFERRRRHLAEEEAGSRRGEVVRLNRVATAGALSSSIAHELNQPLGAILSNTEAAQTLLKADPPDLRQIGEILADIVRDDQRASEIIFGLKNLLDNKKASDLQAFDLNDAVREVAGIVAPEAVRREIILTTDCAAHRLPVRADPIHMQQVILNLAMNALDAMEGCDPKPGKLWIRTSRDAESRIVKLAVTDSGRGIPEDKLATIFEAFFTTKPQGTGLGLPIARTIIQTYGGSIWAENRLRGAAFYFTLPLAKAIAA